MIQNEVERNCSERMKEKFEFLFEPGLIKSICHHGRIRTIDADKQIIGIGDDIKHMPIVLSGSLKVMTEDAEGDELLLYYLEFGETCAVTLNCCTKKTRSTIRAITETTCEIIMVPVEFMENWMIEFSSWRNYVLDTYNNRVNELLKSIDHLVFNSLEARIEKYLQDKAWVTNDSILNVSHSDIANELHSSRVVISRILKKLEKQGLIKQGRNRVELLKIKLA